MRLCGGRSFVSREKSKKSRGNTHHRQPRVGRVVLHELIELVLVLNAAHQRPRFRQCCRVKEACVCVSSEGVGNLRNGGTWFLTTSRDRQWDALVAREWCLKCEHTFIKSNNPVLRSPTHRERSGPRRLPDQNAPFLGRHPSATRHFYRGYSVKISGVRTRCCYTVYLLFRKSIISRYQNQSTKRLQLVLFRAAQSQLHASSSWGTLKIVFLGAYGQELSVPRVPPCVDAQKDGLSQRLASQT